MISGFLRDRGSTSQHSGDEEDVFCCVGACSIDRSSIDWNSIDQNLIVQNLIDQNSMDQNSMDQNSIVQNSINRDLIDPNSKSKVKLWPPLDFFSYHTKMQ